MPHLNKASISLPGLSAEHRLRELVYVRKVIYMWEIMTANIHPLCVNSGYVYCVHCKYRGGPGAEKSAQVTMSKANAMSTHELECC